MRIPKLARVPLALSLLLAGACLSLLGPAGAAGAEFGAPQALVHPDPLPDGASREFGRALAVGRRALAISGWTYHEGQRLDEVFLYERARSDPGRWRLVRRLRPSALGGGLGEYLALDGDRLALGAWGAVHLFERGAGGVWRRHSTLRPKLPGFPGAIALDGDRLAVGVDVPLDKVFVFERERPARGRWRMTARLQGELTSPVLRQASRFLDPDGPAAGFGYSVGLGGDTLAVGSRIGLCCGKGPSGSGIFIFRHDAERGWTQLHNFAPPGLRGTPDEPFAPDEIEFGELLSLSGPFLLAGPGWVEEPVSNRTRVHIYERNHTGPDRWGYRTELRFGRRLDHPFQPFHAVLRGNTAAFIDSPDRQPAAFVFERDFPARDRWGLKAKLPLPLTAKGRVALGPRELVVSDELTPRVLVFPRQPLVESTFDRPSAGGWTGGRGPVEIVSPGLEGSDAAMQVTVGDPTPSFLASSRPRREPMISLRLSLLPNAVSLGGRRVEILRLYAGRPALRLSLEQSELDPMYRATLEVRGPDGDWQRVGRARLLPDRESVLAVEYRAATADGARDAATLFEVNGHLVRRAERLDLDRMLIGRVVLGLPVGSPPTASGSFLVDELEMHR